MFRSWGIAAAAALFAAVPAFGDSIYFGVRNQFSTAAPSGAALDAHDAFLSNFTGHYKIDFEGLSAGARPGSTLGSTLNLPSQLVGGPAVDPTPSAQLVRNSTGTLDVMGEAYNGGYATSGSKYLWSRSNFSIDFAPDPQKAFGFYATDVDDKGGEITVYWDTGASETYQLGNDGTNYREGNLLFFGVIADIGTSITKVSFRGASNVDGFRLDDVLFAYDVQVKGPPIVDGGTIVTAPLPPAAWAGCGLFSLMAVSRWWHRRERAAASDL